jgi:hypothetical protein
VCFVVRKTTSELECVILTTLFLLVQKTLTKDIMSLSPGSSSSSIPQVRDPEIMKFFIMLQFLSLCLMGYAWFGLASFLHRPMAYS